MADSQEGEHEGVNNPHVLLLNLQVIRYNFLGVRVGCSQTVDAGVAQKSNREYFISVSLHPAVLRMALFIIITKLQLLNLLSSSIIFSTGLPFYQSQSTELVRLYFYDALHWFLVASSLLYSPCFMPVLGSIEMTTLTLILNSCRIISLMTFWNYLMFSFSL